MYRHIDEVSVGNPLGQVMANIFVQFPEQKLFAIASQPNCSVCYVDDIFCAFNSELEMDVFMKFYMVCILFSISIVKKESNSAWQFLDVMLHRQNSMFFTSVYQQKPTLTGLYTCWDSFCPRWYKINFLKTLVHQALLICSMNKLEQELETVRKIFCNNGNTLDVVQSKNYCKDCTVS